MKLTSIFKENWKGILSVILIIGIIVMEVVRVRL